MKFLGLVFLSFSVFGACPNLEGIYQTNLPQASIEDVQFIKIDQNACSSLFIYNNGYWSTLMNGPEFDLQRYERYTFDGVQHCGVLNSNCYTASVVNNKIQIVHEVSPWGNDQGLLCKTDRFYYEVNNSGSLIFTVDYFDCSDGTKGSRKFEFPKYIK